jgi:hypothetical protein
VSKSRRDIWTGHVEVRYICNKHVSGGELKERSHLGDLGADVRRLTKLFLRTTV